MLKTKGIQSNYTQGNREHSYTISYDLFYTPKHFFFLLDKNEDNVTHEIKQFNEEKRRHKLIECKQKFQSAAFFQDSSKFQRQF